MSNIKYATYGGSPNPSDWPGTFSAGIDTTKFTDGLAFDSSTYEELTTSGTLMGCYDFGVPTSIDQIKGRYVGQTSITLYYSDDFSSWTTVLISLVSLPNIDTSFTPVVARYWMLVCGATILQRLYDYRLYQSGIQLNPDTPLIGNAIVSQNGNLVVGTFNSPVRVSQVGNLLIGNTSSPFARISQLGLLLLVTSSNDKPQNLHHVVQSDPTQLLLLCDPNSDPNLVISGYRWRRTIDDITWNIIGDTNTPSFIDNIAMRTGYRYKVNYRIGSSGESLTSDIDTYVPIPVILGFSVLINNTAGIYIQGS